MKDHYQNVSPMVAKRQLISSDCSRLCLEFLNIIKNNSYFSVWNVKNCLRTRSFGGLYQMCYFMRLQTLYKMDAQSTNSVTGTQEMYSFRNCPGRLYKKKFQ